MRLGALTLLAVAMLSLTCLLTAAEEEPEKETDIVGYGDVELRMPRKDVLELGYQSTNQVNPGDYLNIGEYLVKLNDPLKVGTKTYHVLVGVTTENHAVNSIMVLLQKLGGPKQAATCYDSLRESLLDKYDNEMVTEDQPMKDGKAKIILTDEDGDTITLSTPGDPSDQVNLIYEAGSEAASKI